MDATTIACTKCNTVLSPEIFTARPPGFLRLLRHPVDRVSLSSLVPCHPAQPSPGGRFDRHGGELFFPPLQKSRCGLRRLWTIPMRPLRPGLAGDAPLLHLPGNRQEKREDQNPGEQPVALRPNGPVPGGVTGNPPHRVCHLDFYLHYRPCYGFHLPALLERPRVPRFSHENQVHPGPVPGLGGDWGVGLGDR